MVRFGAAVVMVAVLVAGCGGGGGAKSTPDPTSEDEKTIYTMGFMLGKRAQQMGLTEQEAAIAARGFYDAAAAKQPVVKPEEYGQKIAAMSQKRTKERADQEKEASKSYLEAAEKEEGAVKTDSGLIFRTLVAGSGASPQATDRVRVHYRGTLRDGTEFDSSYEKAKPAEFALNRVVKCWQEGIPKMKVGEKAKLVCPSTIGYGDRGNPPDIPGGAALTFEVELLEILPPPPAGAPGATPVIRMPVNRPARP